MKRKLLVSVLTGMLVLQMAGGSVWAAEAAQDETVSESAQEEIEAEDEKFATGSMEGQSYVQEFFGCRVDLGEGWVFADEEQLKTMNSQVGDAGSDVIKDAVDSGTSYLDMYAENADTYQTVNATITKLSILEAVSFSTNMDGVISQMIEPAKAEIEKVGLTGAEVTKDETTFLGETVPCVKVVSYPESMGGEIPIYQTQVYLKEGTYLCTITATAYVEDTTADVLAMCSRI